MTSETFYLLFARINGELRHFKNVYCCKRDAEYGIALLDQTQYPDVWIEEVKVEKGAEFINTDTIKAIYKKHGVDVE